MSGRQGPPRRLRLDQRFWKQVHFNQCTGCHEWIGQRDRGGYGLISWNGCKQVVHRLRWMIERGPIPPGLVLDHLCNNPCCCRPEHLQPVTPAENEKRKMRRLLQAKAELDMAEHRDVPMDEVKARRNVRVHAWARTHDQRHPAPSDTRPPTPAESHSESVDELTDAFRQLFGLG